MSTGEDLTGQRFGRLVVRHRTTSAGNRTSWYCDETDLEVKDGN